MCQVCQSARAENAIRNAIAQPQVDPQLKEPAYPTTYMKEEGAPHAQTNYAKGSHLKFSSQGLPTHCQAPRIR